MFWRSKPQTLDGIAPGIEPVSSHNSISAAKDEETGIKLDELYIKDEKGVDRVSISLQNIQNLNVGENEEPDAELDDSPLEEVRAVVPNTDDPDMPCSTFRAWFLGIVFVFLGSGVNVFFSLRYPR